VQPLAASLIKATKNNDVEALKILAEDQALTGVDTREQTLLFYAVKSQSFRALEFLLDAGLSVNHTNYQYETPAPCGRAHWRSQKHSSAPECGGRFTDVQRAQTNPIDAGRRQRGP